MTEKYPLTLLAQAIYSVNKHAKTALDNRFLYALKKNALEKLISQKRAKKIGLHFVNNPKFSQQQSSVLISCADYYFHTLPEKGDFKLLPHLGHLDDSYRNPVRRMSLNRAKEILIDFVGKEVNPKKEYIARKTKPIAKKTVPFLHSSSYFYGH